jgi:hypothetical protein
LVLEVLPGGGVSRAVAAAAEGVMVGFFDVDFVLRIR